MAVEEEDENVLKFMRLALAEVLYCLLVFFFLQNCFLNTPLLGIHLCRTWQADIDIEYPCVQARHALARLEVPVGYMCSPNCK
jgi:hypothetical protein